MKNKCIKCQQIRKASDERKKNKKNKSEMAKTNDELNRFK
jgi:hypothetical protein|uniref:Uncharacterized protein n=1 Tax=Siphoviridae sp. ctZCK1 TaxID=2826382 RepID=A0A8S5MBH7_9CAUD|nr:MAG TPA: hypothetical protein [Siphoviridae sp. ctZCK1]